MMSRMSLEYYLGEAIEDASEETFLLFSQTLPSHTLGFVDGNAGDLEVDVGGRVLTFRQSPGLLNSQRAAGTTGAVLWKITPLIAEWLVSMPQWLQDVDVLHSCSTIVELGCGITGLLGIVLADKVSHYLLTDQSYVMKTLRDNVQYNVIPKTQHKKRRGAVTSSNLQIMPLDWEVDSPTTILRDVSDTDHIDLVIVCDCVYNEHLFQPLVQTLFELCNVGCSGKVTTVMIAQQLRSDTVFESFLEAMLRHFAIWRVPDSHLPDPLHSGSGYIVHLAQLKQHATKPGTTAA